MQMLSVRINPISSPLTFIFEPSGVSCFFHLMSLTKLTIFFSSPPPPPFPLFIPLSIVVWFLGKRLVGFDPYPCVFLYPSFVLHPPSLALGSLLSSLTASL